MPLTDREIWLLNFFRNSELHGALLMGRLARTTFPVELLANMTRHCATEAHHAALLTELLAELGGELDPSLQTMQEHYSREGGVPTELADLLVLSETLEHRVLSVYGEQLGAPGLHPRVRAVLEEILREEEEHGDGEDCWLEQALRTLPSQQVQESRRKWSAIDRKVSEGLYSRLNSLFPMEVKS
jgi:bacterioferritin (cytochrome b1)